MCNWFLDYPRLKRWILRLAVGKVDKGLDGRRKALRRNLIGFVLTDSYRGFAKCNQRK